VHGFYHAFSWFLNSPECVVHRSVALTAKTIFGISSIPTGYRSIIFFYQYYLDGRPA